MLKLIKVQMLPPLDGVVNVGIGELTFVKPPRRAATFALGSCIAVVIFNPLTREGALIHAMLPKPSSPIDENSIGRYVATSIPFVVKKLRRDETNPLLAVLVGGAKILKVCNGIDVGKKNVETARALLREYRVKIVDEDVGGEVSRNVLFDPLQAVVYVTSSSRRSLFS